MYYEVSNSLGVTCYMDRYILMSNYTGDAEALLMSFFGNEMAVKSVVSGFIVDSKITARTRDGDEIPIIKFEDYIYEDGERYAVISKKIKTQKGKSFVNAVVYAKSVFNDRIVVAPSRDKLIQKAKNMFDNFVVDIPIPEESIDHVFKTVAEQRIYYKVDVSLEEFCNSEKDYSSILLTHGIDYDIALISPYFDSEQIKDTIKKYMEKNTSRVA